jgi:hypothetical protein
MDSAIFSPELLQGCRNLLVNYGGIKTDDEVVILSELAPSVEPVVVSAQAAVLNEIGAKFHVLWTPRLQRSWWQDLSPVVRGAVAEADVVLQNMVSIGKTHLLDLMLDKGVRRIRNYATDVAVMSSDWAQFPVEVQDFLELKINTLLDDSKTFRVTTSEGTDISGEIASRIAPWRRDTKRSGGLNVTFPPGVFRASEAESSNGVMYVHATYPWGARRVGLPEIRFANPVKLTVENNLVVLIEGGWEAEAYRKLFEYHVASLGPNAYKIDSFHSGSCPRAFTPMAPQQDPDRFDHLIHEHESWFHFHIGSLSDKAVGKTQQAQHVNAVLNEPTVYLDGEKVWDRGRLEIWQSPELREIAGKYGDPDVLAASRPIWWG